MKVDFPINLEKFKKALCSSIEEVAIEEAAKIGFDVSNEPHGLARAIMLVLSDKEKMKEAMRRAKEVAGIGSE